VAAFQSKRRGQHFLPELDNIKWKNRPTTIAYDSDITSKPEVAHQMQLLEHRLIARGATMYIVTFPAADADEKVGLDDYLLAHSIEEFAKLARERSTIALRLDAFNTEWALIEKPHAYIDLRTKELHKPSAFDDITRNHGPGIPTGLRGEILFNEYWRRWPGRLTYQGVTTDPAHADQPVVNGRYNLYCKPFEAKQPTKKQIKLFYALLDHVLGAESATWRQ